MSSFGFLFMKFGPTECGYLLELEGGARLGSILVFLILLLLSRFVLLASLKSPLSTFSILRVGIIGRCTPEIGLISGGGSVCRPSSPDETKLANCEPDILGISIFLFGLAAVEDSLILISSSYPSSITLNLIF